MNALEKIGERLARGLVQAEDGTWVELQRKLAEEREVREHLERGEVLKDGSWVMLSELTRGSSPTGSAASSPLPSQQDLPETPGGSTGQENTAGA